MQCPYCQSPSYEKAPECPRCGLTMEKAGQFFGAAPRLTGGVSDTSGVLNARERRRLGGLLTAFQRRFPQLGFTAAFIPVAHAVPLPAYAFWIFNKCALGGETMTGGMNRHLFLLVDTTCQRTALTVGYGLEPFVSKQVLTACLEAGAAAFSEGRYCKGACDVLAAAEKCLREISTALPRTFGVTSLRPEAKDEEAAASVY